MVAQKLFLQLERSNKFLVFRQLKKARTQSKYLRFTCLKFYSSNFNQGKQSVVDKV